MYVCINSESMHGNLAVERPRFLLQTCCVHTDILESLHYALHVFADTVDATLGEFITLWYLPTLGSTVCTSFIISH